MEDEKVTLHIPILEILLVLGIISIIIGILAPFQVIEIFGTRIWLSSRLPIICFPLGFGLICGYINKKILPNKKEAYLLGLLLGIIGLGIAIYIKVKSNSNEVNNSNKYEELQRLAELKQSGILTEEEFNIEKEKLLN